MSVLLPVKVRSTGAAGGPFAGVLRWSRKDNRGGHHANNASKNADSCSHECTRLQTAWDVFFFFNVFNEIQSEQ